MICRFATDETEIRAGAPMVIDGQTGKLMLAPPYSRCERAIRWLGQTARIAKLSCYHERLIIGYALGPPSDAATIDVSVRGAFVYNG